jgi:hypothetical protein
MVFELDLLNKIAFCQTESLEFWCVWCAWNMYIFQNLYGVSILNSRGKSCRIGWQGQCQRITNLRSLLLQPFGFLGQETREGSVGFSVSYSDIFVVTFIAQNGEWFRVSWSGWCSGVWTQSGCEQRSGVSRLNWAALSDHICSNKQVTSMVPINIFDTHTCYYSILSVCLGVSTVRTLWHWRIPSHVAECGAIPGDAKLATMPGGPCGNGSRIPRRLMSGKTWAQKIDVKW